MSSFISAQGSRLEGNTLGTAKAKGSSGAEAAAAKVQRRNRLGSPSWAVFTPVPLTQGLPCVPRFLTSLHSRFVPPWGTQQQHSALLTWSMLRDKESGRMEN